jgi:hypothetical protein
MMSRPIFFCILNVFLLTSCQFIEPRKKSAPLKLQSIRNYEEYTTNEHKYLLEYFSRQFLKDYKNHIKKINDPRSLIFLKKIYKELVTNNELILRKERQFSFYIVDTNDPVYFSIPPESYFFSKGLFQHYLNNEETFISLWAREIIKNHSYLYQKNLLGPGRVISLGDMIEINRIPINYTKKLNELTFYAIKRMARDPFALLNWLQIQNKSFYQFRVMYPDQRAIAEEELVFKRFLSKIPPDKKTKQAIDDRNILFYHFLDTTQRL